MYLIILIIALIVSYFLIALILSQLLMIKVIVNPRRIFISLIIIIIFTVISYSFSILIPDVELSNRLLHALGGGFNVVLVTFMAVKSFGINLNLRQFVIISILFICLLGIGNEILEFFMQVFLRFQFATTPIDTWLDLISNSIGGAIGIVIFGLPYLKNHHQ